MDQALDATKLIWQAFQLTYTNSRTAYQSHILPAVEPLLAQFNALPKDTRLLVTAVTLLVVSLIFFRFFRWMLKCLVAAFWFLLQCLVVAIFVVLIIGYKEEVLGKISGLFRGLQGTA